ncbi:unnamed protein product [Gordionus sp. m RMFG-2023]
MILAFAIRLFSVLRFESVIHEFDPYFNYRTTQFLTKEGYYNFHNWFDDMAWYPLGRIIGGTIYPGLMITSSILYHTMNFFHISIDIKDVCVFLAPLFSSLTTLVTYALTKELKDSSAGLLAACLMSMVPGYISRSVAGSYDNEGIAIFCMLLTYYLWIKSCSHTGSIFHSALCALAYFYMVSSWGGYVFLINLIPIHVLVLMIIGRFDHKVYVSYTVFYSMGTLFSMQIPFVGFQPIQSSEHLAAFGIFGICQIYEFVNYTRSKLSKETFQSLIRTTLTVIMTIIGSAILILTITGKIAPWTGRFYTLLDPSYAKNNIPIIASVSEHQPTAWSSFYFDLQILMFLMPAGLYYCFKNLNNGNVFIILYVITSVYFTGVMVRLMLVLAPAMCIIGAIGASSVLRVYIKNLDLWSDLGLNFLDDIGSKPSSKTITSTVSHNSISNGTLPTSQHRHNISKKPLMSEINYPFKKEISMGLVGILTGFFILYTYHCTWVTSEAYSSPSIVLGARTSSGDNIIFDDFRESYWWLRQNTKPDAKIMSWWDYGYQITSIANRTVLVDNNTWNNTHISRVGQAMSSSEEKAYAIMKELDVDYVLVIFGGLVGYSSDDINKFLWMVRIGGSTETGSHIKEADYFTPQGEYKIDKDASKIMLNSLMYKLSYFDFGSVHTEGGKPSGFDRVRNCEIGEKNIKLNFMEESFTTEHWIVRIYKVKRLNNRGLRV